MTDAASKHPDPQTLLAFGRGEMPSDDLTAVEAHLAECTECCKFLESAAGDDKFVSHIRAVGGIGADNRGATGIVGGNNSADSKSPDRIGGYEILRELGRGGMGVVSLARDVRLKRLVALKRISAGELAGREHLVRFRTEAEAVARLQHPNIVQIYEIGEFHGMPFISLEYVEGGTLSSYLDGKPQTPRDSATLLRTLALAVDYAHQQGIVHRDLKPANVLLGTADRPTSAGSPFSPVSANENGSVTPVKSIRDLQSSVPKITDFGLAKQMGQQNHLTQTGQLAGTPSYMSPEQVRGGTTEIGPATDVYSLGVILYQMVTGQLPFRGATPLDVMNQVRNAEPVPPSRFAAMPIDLETICLKCLAKEPKQRYASANALADDLSRFLEDRPILARQASALERLHRWGRRNPAVAALSSALIVLAIGAFIAVFVQWRSAVASAIEARFNERSAEAMRAIAEKERDNARDHLYDSMLSEAQAVRLARQPGYRDRVWDRLRQAVALGAKSKDPESFKGEAVACLGDFLGAAPLSLPPFRARIMTVSLDGAGELLALGLEDGTRVIHETRTGNVASALQSPTSGHGFVKVEFLRDGRLLTASYSDGVRFWQRGGDKSWLPDTSFPISAAPDATSATPDGDRVAVAKERFVMVYRRGGGLQGLPFFVPAKADRIAISPDGRFLAAAYAAGPRRGDASAIRIWSTADQKVLATLTPQLNSIYSIRFSADGRFFGCSCLEGVAIYEAPDFGRTGLIRGAMAYDMVFHPDGRTIAVPSAQEDVVRLLTVSSNREIAQLPQPGQPRLTAFSGDGQVAVTCSHYVARVWRLGSTAEKLVLSGHEGGIPGVAFGPDGGWLATVGKDGTVRIWDSRTGHESKRLAGMPNIGQALAVSADGRFVAATDYTAGTMLVWHIATGRVVATVKNLGARVHSVGFSADGKLLAVGAVPGLKIMKFEVEPQADASAVATVRLQPIDREPPKTDVGHLCFSRDNRWLAWATDTSIVHVLDLKSGKEAFSPGRVYARVQSLAFFPDGKRLVFLNDRKEAEIWDVAAASRIATFPAPGARNDTGGGTYAMHIALNPDGSRLAVSSPTGRGVNLWDVPSGKLLLALPEESGVVWCMAWSPDGQRLAVSRSDGGLAIWNLAIVQKQLAELGLKL